MNAPWGRTRGYALNLRFWECLTQLLNKPVGRRRSTCAVSAASLCDGTGYRMGTYA